MNLVIDIGNTLTKAAVFDGDKISFQKKFKNLSAGELKKIIRRNFVDRTIVSSVKKQKPTWISIIRKNNPVLFLDQSTKLPFRNLYETPATLGRDRIAAVAGAIKKFPGENILVIDAGTCITFDFVNNKKEYVGGSIAPGLKMRFQSLHEFTAALPFVKPSEKISLTGTTTKTAIISGVQQGMLAEVDGIITLYQNKFKQVRVVLTGGDAPFFVRHLKNSIFAAPNLVPQGLNEILNHNAAN